MVHFPNILNSRLGQAKTRSLELSLGLRHWVEETQVLEPSSHLLLPPRVHLNPSSLKGDAGILNRVLPAVPDDRPKNLPTIKCVCFSIIGEF